jgi:hypothetical protein
MRVGLCRPIAHPPSAIRHPPSAIRQEIRAVHYHNFDRSEDTDGVTTLEAMASTAAGQHAAVIAEVQQVLDWAWLQFPDTHGAADDGMDWDHDLQLQVEPGEWHTVTLTLTGSDRFVDAFGLRFGGLLA